MILFWILASTLAVLQCGVGIAIAKLVGADPLLGIISGSMTMTGGHGTGAAFGKLLEDQYGMTGAVTVAMAAATFGLVSGGLIGGPVGTTLINKFKLRPSGSEPSPLAQVAKDASLDAEIDTEPAGEAATAYLLLKTMTVVLVCMALGAIFSKWLGQYVTLPGYIGAMLVAALFRNVAEGTGVMRIEQRVVDDLGTIALALFLTMALMTLRLWELLDLAGAMLAIGFVQVAMMAAFAYWVTFRFMGRDFDSAVMAAGHCGFGLGATPNAVANMEALTERFGPAPRAFLVLPMVGAFFIDFTNAVIITTYINLVR